MFRNHQNKLFKHVLTEYGILSLNLAMKRLCNNFEFLWKAWWFVTLPLNYMHQWDLYRSFALLGYTRHVIKKYKWRHKNASNTVLSIVVNYVSNVLRYYLGQIFFSLNCTVSEPYFTCRFGTSYHCCVDLRGGILRLAHSLWHLYILKHISLNDDIVYNVNGKHLTVNLRKVSRHLAIYLAPYVPKETLSITIYLRFNYRPFKINSHTLHVSTWF